MNMRTNINHNVKNNTETKAETHRAKRRGANREKKKKKERVHSRFSVLLAAVIVLMNCYYAFTFINIPPLRFMRNLWIETAMTTMRHQWLATYFFPDFIIDEVMSQQTKPLDSVLNADGGKGEWSVPEDVLGQKELEIGDEDIAGNKILVNNIEQGIIISELKTGSYSGRMVMIDDPGRVVVGYTKSQGKIGMKIADFLDEYDAVVGMNASGFYDSGGHGNGGEVLGRSMSFGKSWGEYDADMDSICFDSMNRLIVGKMENWEKYDVRDGIQFTPVLVADGEKYLSGSGGYGLQPRTCIGQRWDGAVLFLVIDGRQPGHSVGATMSDCADIMMQYDAKTAVACDGGSSAVLAYDGRVITKPSGGDRKNGRYLPNAFLVKRKQ